MLSGRLYVYEGEGDVVTAAWVVLALGLFAAELHHLAFFAFFGAVGALAGAAVSVFAPGAFVVQGLAAVSICVLGILLGRPYVSRALWRPRGAPAAVGVHGGIVGQRVVVSDEVTERAGGHVVLAGETWLARSLADTTIGKDDPAVVISVEGTTLLVYPTE